MNKFDSFGKKAGLYHRLYMYSLPASLFLIYASNTRTFGLILLIFGIPFFWKLRNNSIGE